MRKLFLLGCVAPLALSGCAVLTQTEDVATPVRTQSTALRGAVHGGNQPVTGATVTLYSAGTSGDGSAATVLATTSTGSSGTFIFGAYTYTCSSQQLYVVATGGNPGLSASNPQLSLMTALGPCSSVTSSTNITINELTTVAAVSALSTYMVDYAHVGSSSSDASTMASAFTLAGELVSTSAGTTPGGTIPQNYTSPASLIDTLGDILATCVNSTGGTGNGTTCGPLFTDTTPYQGTSPSETIGAMLLLSKNPNQNVTTAFALATSNGPFQPILTAAPADWTVPLLPTGAIRILFVGDSFTHGRYAPVRNYNNSNVTDENYDINGAANSTAANRTESSTEPGPYGGIPGIFKELTVEGGLNYDVHIEAISSTSLAKNYSYAGSVIANPQWNAVVLQELSYLPIPSSQSGMSSDPNTFCNSVKTIEQGVHSNSASPSASIYLYETWARADEAHSLVNGSATFAQALGTLTTSYHNVYYQAASPSNDSNITGVAPVGDAWLAAMSGQVMNETDPYTSTMTPPYFLWFLSQTNSSPSTTGNPDYLHPSIYGAYLSALVLYEKITGLNSTNLGSTEAAAATLGISGTIATQLQSIAHSQVQPGSTSYAGTPCSATS